MNRACGPGDRKRRRWGVHLLLASLTTIVVLRQLYPPEPAVNAGYFTGGPPFDDPAYLEGFPDLGSLDDAGAADAAGLIDHWWEAWNYGVDWNDTVIYLETAATCHYHHRLTATARSSPRWWEPCTD